MTDIKNIAELIYEKLCENDLSAIQSLLSEELSHEMTEKLRLTRTPVLNSIGQRLGKLLLDEKWKFDSLKGYGIFPSVRRKIYRRGL